MTVWETLLVFGVVPLAGFGLLALLVYGPSLDKTTRYRPGRPWEYDPVWYIPRPGVEAARPSGSGEPALEGRPERAALPERGASRREPPASVLDAPVRTARGGASGEW